ncbi:hypothetical protein K9N68_01565 [Kovacikia minuta CCNUW1]|uniref:hypothetical protein n=1 Tax=Kovacikia minuta TaxID=2931930 RepID=UPI001CCE9399|nr:hypothetical protein [Kovacikia minuta]UBF26718.1 hypothetical protein K9N68_01565 [Kovacikia minuta CCNUW1]
MHGFYLIAFTATAWIAARYLWKFEQVYAIAALLAGLISLIWGLTCTPAWVQLLVAGLLLGLYWFRTNAFLEAVQQQVPIRKE